MYWKKVEVDTSKDYIIMIQNSSIIPNSLVYIQFTEKDQPDPNQHSFILTGPNQWDGRLKSGTNLFYAEEHGGIFTYSTFPVEKLENYDIETKHLDIIAANQTISCPEGSYFVIQNKSETPLSFSIEGKGKFVLVQHQMLSFTFAKDQTVTLNGSGQKVSYLIGEAPSLTQLSKEVQDKLNQMYTIFQNVMNIIVTMAEFTRFKTEMITQGKWSKIIKNTKPDTNITMGVFLQDRKVYSKWLDEHTVIDLCSKVYYRKHESTTQENDSCNIYYRLELDRVNHKVNLCEFECDDLRIRENIRNIKVEWINYAEPTIGAFRVITTMDAEFNARVISTESTVRVDHCAFTNSTDIITFPDHAEVEVFRINDLVTFADDQFYQEHMITTFDHKESDYFRQTWKNNSGCRVQQLGEMTRIETKDTKCKLEYTPSTRKLQLEIQILEDIRPISFTLYHQKDPKKSVCLNLLYTNESCIKGTSPDIRTFTYTMASGRITDEVFKAFFDRLEKSDNDYNYRLKISY